MFERFGDLPLHVLVIHLTVVLLPVAALTLIAFAVYRDGAGCCAGRR